jgi:hypothetical protein
MQFKSHSIVRLPVHLPNEQEVYFAEELAEEALATAESRDTMLTAWFKLNQSNEPATGILYPDTPNHYTFDAKKRTWNIRKKGHNDVIGRMYTVSPRDLERFFLRLVLLHVANAKSFVDLRTVNGVTASTFQEAAVLLGLVERNEQWIKCMEEAVHSAMPSAIRGLFVTILIYGNLPNIHAQELWNTFQSSMCEDFSHRFTPEKGLYLGYTDINKRLASFGKTLLEPYGIQVPPKPVDVLDEVIDREAELHMGNEMLQLMNKEQQFVATSVMEAAKGSNGKCFFLDAPGGTGKTFLFSALAHKLEGDGIPVMCIASTGIAANLLPRGTTVNTGLGLPINLVSKQSRLSVKAGSPLEEKLKRTRVIFWDEAAMSSATALDVVEISLRELMGNNQLFGGKVIVLGGDFRQILPVVPHAHKSQQLAACLKRSQLWTEFTTLRLTKNVRADPEQVTFCDWLLKLGEGLLPTINDEVEIPEHCITSGK